MATRTTTKTTIKPTYVKNTNVKGTKTGVSNNSRGTKTTVVKNAAGTTYTKVTNAAGKTFTKATDSKGNVITPKVKAKATVVAPAKITKTTVVTPKAKAVAPAPVKAKMDTIPVRNTTPKDYEIYDRANLDRRGSLYHGTGLYGTKAQQDSSIASITKHNVKAPGRFWITKSSYFPGDEGLAKYAKTSKIDYVPPKNTNSGPLRKKPQTKASDVELYKRYN